MTQIIFQATTSDGSLSAATLGAGESAVMRGTTGNDTLIGSDGADRLDAGNGVNSMLGGAGADMFFTNISAHRYDTIDGGTGTDSLFIAMNSAQLASAGMHDALVALNDFVTYTARANPDAHFVNATLGLDLTSVEVAQVRLDGVVKALDEVGAPAHHVDFESALSDQAVSGAVPGEYAGFNWQTPYNTGFYRPSYFSTVQDAAIPASGDVGLIMDTGSMVITKTGGGTFVFAGTDYSNVEQFSQPLKEMDIIFTGKLGDTVVGTTTVHATSASWSTLHVDWGSIDSLTVTSHSVENTTFVALDNMFIG